MGTHLQRVEVCESSPLQPTDPPRSQCRSRCAAGRARGRCSKPQAQLAQNSPNSSKPPSSDPPWKRRKPPEQPSVSAASAFRTGEASAFRSDFAVRQSVHRPLRSHPRRPSSSPPPACGILGRLVESSLVRKGLHTLCSDVNKKSAAKARIQFRVGITMSVAHRHPREGGGPVGRPSENGNPVHQLSGFPPPRE